VSDILLDIHGLTTEIATDVGDGEAGQQILRDVELTIRAGEVHVLMGKNGSGKSTLAHVLMGHPGHRVTSGSVEFRGEDLLAKETDERARAGLFLAFQYPLAVPGLASATFLKSAAEAVRGEEVSVREFRGEIRSKMKAIGIDRSFLSRSLNEGFSGGEKKRLEILQMSLLSPTLAILDETDSGLDVDAMRHVFEYVQEQRTDETSLLMITHYNRILNFVEPTHVHLMENGSIVKTGGRELSDHIEAHGFESLLETEGK
jgi:Fe-S cluster assembly ATP-binding protein